MQFAAGQQFNLQELLDKKVEEKMEKMEEISARASGEKGIEL